MINLTAVRVSIVALALSTASCSVGDGRTQDTAKLSSPSPSYSASDTTVIEIRGPTLLAHFPVTQAAVDSSPDLGEALTDFQYHLDRSRDFLAQMGIAVEERYTPVVRYRVERQLIRSVPPADSVVAYVFVAPDRPTRTHYGVVTDADLRALAARFLAGRPDP